MASRPETAGSEATEDRKRRGSLTDTLCLRQRFFVSPVIAVIRHAGDTALIATRQSGFGPVLIHSSRTWAAFSQAVFWGNRWV